MSALLSDLSKLEMTMALRYETIDRSSCITGSKPSLFRSTIISTTNATILHLAATAFASVVAAGLAPAPDVAA